MSNSTQPSSELIDVRPLGDALANSKHASLLDSDHVKIKRMVLPAGKELSEHKAPGDIVVQCLEGCFEFTTQGKTHKMEAGRLIHLTSGQLHSLKAIEDSSFLLTIFQKSN